MKGQRAVVGVFTNLDDAVRAIHVAKEGKYEYRVYSPFASHHLESESTSGRSPVRFLTSVGALTGITFGFALPIMCSLDYPLRVSSKDIVSIPGFVVIGYECTILFGAICTLLGLLHFCKLPDIFRKTGYDPRFSDDKFGVVIGCGVEHVDEVSGAFKKAGADEVEVRDAF